MRRVVAALIVVVLALSLAGCSSGASSSSSSAPASTTAAPVNVSAAAAAATVADRSANTSDTFVAFPTGANVPAALKQRITVEKRPTLIYFYDSKQKTSAEVRKIIDSVRDDNKGAVDLVVYDIGKYTTTNEDGSVTIKTQDITSPDDRAAVELARDPAINVTFTPFIVVTDSQGYIVYTHRGLADRAFLEREVLRASR